MSNPREDAEYLKSPEIGEVLAMGMAVTYRTNPKMPIEFFAKWLLNHSKVQRQQLAAEDKALKVKELKEKREYQQKEQAKENEKLEAVEK